MSAHVLIAGAGIGGLTAGLALLRNGFSVELFEAAPTLGEVGAGVTLAPNAMHGMQYLGIADDILRCSIEPERQYLRRHDSGEVIRVLERGAAMKARYGAPYCYTHRADLHAILVAAVRSAGGSIHLSSAVTDAGTEGRRGWIGLADGRRIDADLVIGADGVRSAVREIFEPAPPHFSGHIAFRGIVAAEGPLAEFVDCPGNFVGPERLIAFYPLRGGTLLNLVFFARQSGWEQDGWTIPARRDELAAIYAGWLAPVQEMIARLDETRLFKWAINTRSPLERWSVGGRLTLVGDAAHAMTPFLGQGASCAIEDGVVLARALAAAGSVPEGLARYERARKERATLIQLESNAHANRLQNRDSNVLKDKELRNEEGLGLFTYDCGSVPV